MTVKGTTSTYACDTLRPAEWGVAVADVTDAGSWIDTLIDPDTGGMTGYTYVPEALALWTTNEEYYNSLITVSFAPTGTHAWAFNTYEDFKINPFTGYCIDLWALLVGVLPGDAYTTGVEYITVDCDPAMYEPGFMKAPIPVIPFMVDSYTPPRSPSSPDIPPIPWMDIEDLVYDAFRNGSSSGCVSYVWDEATKSFVISTTFGGQGIVLAGGTSTCDTFGYPSGDGVYVLTFQNGGLQWVLASECQTSEGSV